MLAKRQNTKLESEGAEFLVLGNLLIEGISAYKAYVNFPGYDLTAVIPETRKVARLQVKSRSATNYDKSFLPRSGLLEQGNPADRLHRRLILTITFRGGDGARYQS